MSVVRLEYYYLPSGTGLALGFSSTEPHLPCSQSRQPGTLLALEELPSGVILTFGKMDVWDSLPWRMPWPGVDHGG